MAAEPDLPQRTTARDLADRLTACLDRLEAGLADRSEGAPIPTDAGLAAEAALANGYAALLGVHRPGGRR